MTFSASNKLSNIQVELLKLFSTNLNEKDLSELKQQLANFYANKSIQLADNFWNENQLNDDIMDKWINEQKQ